MNLSVSQNIIKVSMGDFLTTLTLVNPE